jgi:hypothetical protein
MNQDETVRGYRPVLAGQERTAECCDLFTRSIASSKYPDQTFVQGQIGLRARGSSRNVRETTRTVIDTPATARGAAQSTGESAFQAKSTHQARGGT